MKRSKCIREIIRNKNRLKKNEQNQPIFNTPDDGSGSAIVANADYDDDEPAECDDGTVANADYVDEPTEAGGDGDTLANADYVDEPAEGDDGTVANADYVDEPAGGDGGC